MSIRKYLACLIILFSVIKSGVASNDDVRADLIGFWHAVPGMPSGFAESYSFYEEGNYIYHGNQMECSRRVLKVTGSWDYSNDTLKGLAGKLSRHLVHAGMVVS